jgi:3-deoxy-7-phosphoheptulonate synthase
MDGTFAINKGLRLARSLLLEISELGLPVGCEFLDTITPQYTADLVSWGAIGARTTESQVSVLASILSPVDSGYSKVHRELVSALSMPTGFKNSTDGTTSIAIDACRAACSPHVFLSVGKEGLSSIVETSGNPDVHVILRGGSSGPNYEREWVEKCTASLKKGGVVPRVMVRPYFGD